MKHSWQFQAAPVCVRCTDGGVGLKLPACNAPPRHAVQRKQTGAASARRDTADPERLAQRACAARHLALELPPALTASVRCEPLQNEGRGSRQLQHRFWIQTKIRTWFSLF
jgi:hypothetical protein